MRTFPGVLSIILLMVLFPGGNLRAEQKMWFVHPVSFPAARLESVRLADDKKCGENQLRVEELFAVAGYDPAELLLVRESETGSMDRVPVQWVDAAGRIVHTYCADRDMDTTVKAWFLRYDGHATPPLGYRIQVRGNAAEGSPTPLVPLHRKTRYQQFASKEQPEKGTCCWHYVYTYYDQPSAEKLTSLTIPLTIKEAPEAGSHMYFQFHTAINSVRFYFGLQTDLFNKGKSQGAGAIFSRWDTQDSADLEVAPGGFAEIAAHEGRFVGVRRVVPWGAGQWNLQLNVRDKKETGNPDHLWLELTLNRLDGKMESPFVVGSLRFPGRMANLTRELTVVAESYAFSSTRSANVWQVPPFDLFVHPPQFNGKPFATLPRITYPEKAPRIVKAVIQDNGVRLHRDGLLR
ncbi:MAG: hypothetical protein HQL63_07020 [Magnetococcales bacterium]|nr:hypothetical protein [Magnetococcales bacterium]MBF0321946.1 hypothetical protein [Magnetococcales bacterium]